MSVLIKGVDMPEDCYECPCFNGDYVVCNVVGIDLSEYYTLHKDCPLVEIDLVRCCECNHSETDGAVTFCMRFGALRKPIDFCSYGERRE